MSPPPMKVILVTTVYPKDFQEAGRIHVAMDEAAAALNAYDNDGVHLTMVPAKERPRRPPEKDVE